MLFFNVCLYFIGSVDLFLNLFESSETPLVRIKFYHNNICGNIIKLNFTSRLTTTASTTTHDRFRPCQNLSVRHNSEKPLLSSKPSGLKCIFHRPTSQTLSAKCDILVSTLVFICLSQYLFRQNMLLTPLGLDDNSGFSRLCLPDEF